MNRFLSIVCLLSKRAYKAFMNEYEDLGHMKHIKHLKIKHYSLPHHAAVKQDSLAAKIRVVFGGLDSSSCGSHSIRL